MKFTFLAFGIVTSSIWFFKNLARVTKFSYSTIKPSLLGKDQNSIVNKSLMTDFRVSISEFLNQVITPKLFDLKNYSRKDTKLFFISYFDPENVVLIVFSVDIK